jgi:magnesium transporter
MASSEDVLKTLAAAGVGVLPVVDGQGRLLGVIRQDSIIQAVKEQATDDLATLVGASKDELALSPPLFAVRKRLPWLNINLLTAFLAAAVVGLFESTIAQFTALAVLLPVVAGQSGNTGAQALAITIRGLALREIRSSDFMPVLIKEAIAGTLNGIAVAIVTSIAVYFWSGSLGLCLVIFLSMVIAMAIAGVAGAAIPLVLAAMKQDPAQSGSIILTTVTDVFGFFSFLGLATIFSAIL